MSYVNSVLQPGERVVMRGRLHWIVYWHAIVFLVLGSCCSAGRLRRHRRMMTRSRRSCSACCSCVVRARLVHPLDHRDRGDRPAHHLQARLHHPAHRRDEHGQGRLGRCRPVDPRPHARLRHDPCARDRRRSAGDSTAQPRARHRASASHRCSRWRCATRSPRNTMLPKSSARRLVLRDARVRARDDAVDALALLVEARRAAAPSSTRPRGSLTRSGSTKRPFTRIS